MEFVIIAGLSGAGKSHAADILEDMGYYRTDNMPAALLPRFAELCRSEKKCEKVVLVADTRENEDFSALSAALDEIGGMGISVKVLYLDADIRTIIRRYKENRRPHPLGRQGESIESAVKKESELLGTIKARADHILDTSDLTLGMLHSKISSIFPDAEESGSIAVTVMSFGYKYGLPMEADIVFDARFLPNPYYVEKLRPMCGLDAPVSDYVFSFEQSVRVLGQLEKMIEYLLPLYTEEGKRELTVAIGCTGGRHRSVALASALSSRLCGNGVRCMNVNRDIDR